MTERRDLMLPLQTAEAFMRVLWITCPTTKQHVSTGIETDAESFEALPAFTLTLTCPACGDIHPWGDMQGTLVDTPSEWPTSR